MSTDQRHFVTFYSPGTFVHEETTKEMKRKPIKLWGGFSEGRLHTTMVDTGWGGFGTGDMVEVPAVFRTRKEARKKYEDVRRIEIREENPHGK